MSEEGRTIRVPLEPLLLAFGPSLVPVLTVTPGTRLSFPTLDACAGAVASEADRVTLAGVGSPGGNPATGPVAIEGAEPGDTLIVDIISIRLAGVGFVNAFPGVGPLASRISAERTWMLELEDGLARRGWLELPLRPMIGVIGVATGGETAANDFAGRHGGNLDNRFVTVGSRVYLPVRQRGAQLALGDVHAAMGDGELTASGLETAAVVTVDVDLLKGRSAEWPIVETAERWYAHGLGASWDEAATIACEQAAAQLEREWAMSPEEVPLYLALAGDLAACQAARPGPFPVVVRLGVQRTPAAPAAFRPQTPRSRVG